jgi:hypothetical protein
MWPPGHLSRSFAAMARCLNPPPSSFCRWNDASPPRGVEDLERYFFPLVEIL